MGNENNMIKSVDDILNSIKDQKIALMVKEISELCDKLSERKQKRYNDRIKPLKEIEEDIVIRLQKRAYLPTKEMNAIKS